MFHKPFRKQLGKFSRFAQFPESEAACAETSHIWKAISKTFHRRRAHGTHSGPSRFAVPPLRFLGDLKALCNRIMHC